MREGLEHNNFGGIIEVTKIGMLLIKQIDVEVCWDLEVASPEPRKLRRECCELLSMTFRGGISWVMVKFAIKITSIYC